jgi:hypothetical protein
MRPIYPIFRPSSDTGSYQNKITKINQLITTHTSKLPQYTPEQFAINKFLIFVRDLTTLLQLLAPTRCHSIYYKQLA